MVGRQVYHKNYGRGVIAKSENSLITVEFATGPRTFLFSHPICRKMLKLLPEEDNKIICLWGKSFEFSREVIAHFILKDHPEYKDCIKQKVDAWFGDFEGSTYQGDCMTSPKIDLWFNSYFEDLGCDENHVVPYIKDFLHCFQNGDVLYQRYSDYIGIGTYGIDFNLRPLFYARAEAAMAYNATAIYRSVIPKGNVVFDYKKAVDIITKFDEDFDWISKYEFNPTWKTAFCLIVHSVYIKNKTFDKNETNVSQEFEQRTEMFLKKYLTPIDQPLTVDFLSRRLNRFHR